MIVARCEPPRYLVMPGERTEEAEAVPAKGVLGGRGGDVDSRKVLDLAFRSNCTTYDCEYIALAKRWAFRSSRRIEQCSRPSQSAR